MPRNPADTPTTLAPWKTYPTISPENGEPIWDRESAENHIRRMWPRAIQEQPNFAKAAVRVAYLRGSRRPDWTVGDLAADAEARLLGVPAASEDDTPPTRPAYTGPATNRG